MNTNALRIYRQRWRIFSRWAIAGKLQERRSLRVRACFYRNICELIETLKQKRLQAWEKGDMPAFFDLQDDMRDAIEVRDKYEVLIRYE